MVKKEKTLSVAMFYRSVCWMINYIYVQICMYHNYYSREDGCLVAV